MFQTTAIKFYDCHLEAFHMYIVIRLNKLV